MNWIENICEPRRLFLAWQAPDHAGDRFRWAVGEVTASPQIQLRYYTGDEFASHNQGRSVSDIEHLGYRGYPGFRTRVLTHTDGVAESLMRRLPPRSRSDFDEYRKHFRLSATLAVSDFALLAYTEAKLPSDGFSVVNPLDCGEITFELMLEVAGARYYTNDTPRLQIGQQVQFVAEPDNHFDANAIMVCVAGFKIGYVNRLQAKAFRRWLGTADLQAVVERINGTSDRPRIFLFVRVRNNDRVAA